MTSGPIKTLRLVVFLATLMLLESSGEALGGAEVREYRLDFFAGLRTGDDPDAEVETRGRGQSIELKTLDGAALVAWPNASTFNLDIDLRPEEPRLRSAFLTAPLGSDVLVHFGQKRLNLGGFFRLQEGPYELLSSPYLNRHRPFPYSQPVVELTWAELFSVQLTDDVTTESTSSGVFTDKHLQPAALWQLSTRRSSVSALVQGALYDLNKSHFITLGLAYEGPVFQGFVDITRDRRRQKYLHGGSALLPMQDYSNSTLSLAAFPDADVRPFAQAVVFDVSQPDVPVVALEDRDANVHGLDDNARIWLVGAKMGPPRSAIVTVVGYSETSGRYTDDDGGVESRTQRTLWLGFGTSLHRRPGSFGLESAPKGDQHAQSSPGP